MVWLLVIITGLTVGCVVLYCRLRQMESVDRARQSLFADELRDAEAALLSALERVEAMDRRLASRERQAAEPAPRSRGMHRPVAACRRTRSSGTISNRLPLRSP